MLSLKNPDQIAASLFPREAAANRTIFYDHGTPRTIRQVYKALVAQHEGPAGLHPGYAVQQMVASQADGYQRGVSHRSRLPRRFASEGNSKPIGGDVAQAVEIPSRIGPQNMSFSTLFSTEPGGSTGSPIPSALEEGQGAFFTQLYGREIAARGHRG